MLPRLDRPGIPTECPLRVIRVVLTVHRSLPVLSGLCCKTPKMARSVFSAKRATKRQSPIDVSSSPLPKLPVSSSPVAAVPHTIIRSPRPKPGKFVVSDPKRVLQHYLPTNGHCAVRTQRPKSANGLNRSRGRELRRAAVPIRG
jgi:hypothetical protein